MILKKFYCIDGIIAASDEAVFPKIEFMLKLAGVGGGSNKIAVLILIFYLPIQILASVN